MQEKIQLFHHVKDRASRIQSENSFSDFVEAPPIFERSSKIDFCLSTLQNYAQKKPDG